MSQFRNQIKKNNNKRNHLHENKTYQRTSNDDVNDEIYEFEDKDFQFCYFAFDGKSGNLRWKYDNSDTLNIHQAQDSELNVLLIIIFIIYY